MDNTQQVNKPKSRVFRILVIIVLVFLGGIVLLNGGRHLLIANLESCTRTFPYINSSFNIKLQNKLVYQGGVGSVCISELDGKGVKKIFDANYPEKTFLSLDSTTEKIYYSKEQSDYSSGRELTTYTIFEQNLKDDSTKEIFSFTPEHGYFVTDSLLMSDDNNMAVYSDDGVLKTFSLNDQKVRILFNDGCSAKKTTSCYSYDPLIWSPDKKTLLVSRYFRSDKETPSGEKLELLKVDPLAETITSSVLSNDISSYDFNHANWLPDSSGFIVWTGEKLLLFNPSAQKITDLTKTEWGNLKNGGLDSYIFPIQVQSISSDAQKATILITRGITIIDDNDTPEKIEGELFILDLKNNISKSIIKRSDKIGHDWFDGGIENPITIKTIWSTDNQNLFVRGLKDNDKTEILDTLTMKSKSTNLSVTDFIGFIP